MCHRIKYSSTHLENIDGNSGSPDISTRLFLIRQHNQLGIRSAPPLTHGKSERNAEQPYLEMLLFPLRETQAAPGNKVTLSLSPCLSVCLYAHARTLVGGEDVNSFHAQRISALERHPEIRTPQLPKKEKKERKKEDDLPTVNKNKKTNKKTSRKISIIQPSDSISSSNQLLNRLSRQSSKGEFFSPQMPNDISFFFSPRILECQRWR